MAEFKEYRTIDPNTIVIRQVATEDSLHGVTLMPVGKVLSGEETTPDIWYGYLGDAEKIIAHCRNYPGQTVKSLSKVGHIVRPYPPRLLRPVATELLPRLVEGVLSSVIERDRNRVAFGPFVRVVDNSHRLEIKTTPFCVWTMLLKQAAVTSLVLESMRRKQAVDALYEDIVARLGIRR